MGKEELHFATCFSAKQTTENGKEVLRLAFCGVFRRNKHALSMRPISSKRALHSRRDTNEEQQVVRLAVPRIGRVLAWAVRRTHAPLFAPC